MKMENVKIRKITTEDLKKAKFRIISKSGSAYLVDHMSLRTDSPDLSYRHIACQISIISCEVGKELSIFCPTGKIPLDLLVDRIEMLDYADRSKNK